MTKETQKNKGIMVNHIIFVLDKSGSMGHLRRQTVDNMNEQLSQLKIDAETNHVNLVSLVTFNSKVQRVRESVPLGQFEEFKLEEYEPGGWTALYDGIGEAVMLADTGFEKYAGMDNSALIVILSDGMENKSVEYSKAKIAEIIKDRQDGGRFTLTFLGCGEHIVSQATAIHIPLGNTTVWANDVAGLAGTVCLNSVGTRSYMIGRNSGESACSGFYQQPDIDHVHVTGVEDFADKSLFPHGPPSGYADSPYNEHLTSGTPYCYRGGTKGPTAMDNDGNLVFRK